MTALEAFFVDTGAYSGSAGQIESTGVTVTPTVGARAIKSVTGLHAGCNKGTYTFAPTATPQYSWS